LWLLLDEEEEEPLPSQADGGVHPSPSVEIVSPGGVVVGTLVSPLHSAVGSTPSVSV